MKFECYLGKLDQDIYFFLLHDLASDDGRTHYDISR